ncbi:MAG: glycosyltransferase [Actinomycetota bacterium]
MAEKAPVAEAGPAARPVEIPRIDRPDLSILMLTFGGWEWARRSLEAVAEHTPARYEVVIVDNASPPDTVAALRRDLVGARIVFNDRNVGFGPGMNLAARNATGRTLCLLNSDCLVEPGWLDPLLEVLDADPLAGAAVPRLLNLDGSLQEAGAAVSSDGSTVAIGDGDDPDDDAYAFRRYVEYGSAACLVIRRELFLELGGFDPAFGLGYCEDVDLCLRLRQRGLRVVYEPGSRVVHARWGSAPREEAIRRVRRNTEILRSRWRSSLRERPSLDDPLRRPPRLMAARDAGTVQRILVAHPRLPLDRWGSADRDLAEALPEIARLWPENRLTVTLDKTAPAIAEEESWRALGVEVARPRDFEEDWLALRLGHYAACIVADVRVLDERRRLLAETHPGAARVWWAGRPQSGAEEHTDGERRAAGWAELVVCASDEERDRWRAVAPGLRVVVVPRGLVVADPAPGFGDRIGVCLLLPDEPLCTDGLYEGVVSVLAQMPDLPVQAIAPGSVAQARVPVPVVANVANPRPFLLRARVGVAFAPTLETILEVVGAGTPFLVDHAPTENESGPAGGERDNEAVAEYARVLHADPGTWDVLRAAQRDAWQEVAPQDARREGLVEVMAELGVPPPDRRSLRDPAGAKLSR